MQIFLEPNEAQSYFTTCWILFQRGRKRRVELSPLVFPCGKLAIFELWGHAVFAPQQPLSSPTETLACFLCGVLLFSAKETPIHGHATVLNFIYIMSVGLSAMSDTR